MSDKRPAGGAFLTDDEMPDMFIPEEFSEEQLMIKEGVREFIKKEIVPLEKEFEKKDYESLRAFEERLKDPQYLMRVAALGNMGMCEVERKIADAVVEFTWNEARELEMASKRERYALIRENLKKLADLGYLGADIPEEFGGMALDKVSSAAISEGLAISASFAITAGAHIGIGTLPIRYYGNDEQKKRFLSRLVSAEIVAAYALTEAEAGSDAQNIQTKAMLSGDGKHYVLNGSKIWISNAGFADLYTVFAKVDGDRNKITAFLVERNSPGFSVGEEEHKMGLHGSSTAVLAFTDVYVPVENVLGNVGDGFKMALNILNLGRFKLAVACVGGAKHILEFIGAYAKNRIAFGRPLRDFPLIKEKFGLMLTRLWLCESVAYRTAGLLETAISAVGDADAKSTIDAIREYSIECSLNKVLASEMLDLVVDESVQIHGGNGYDDSQPTARAYRDSRVNRIFEGTNEINRMLAAGTILKQGFSGKIPLFALAAKYQKELLEFAPPDSEEEGILLEQKKVLRNLKKLVVLLFGAAAQRYRDKIEGEQEVLAKLADAAMSVFALESGIVRAAKLAAVGSTAGPSAMYASHVARLAAYDASKDMSRIGEEVLAHVIAGDELRAMQVALRKLVKCEVPDCIALRRELAEAFYSGQWKFI